jgi:hypothetical protein
VKFAGAKVRSRNETGMMKIFGVRNRVAVKEKRQLVMDYFFLTVKMNSFDT